MEKENGEHGESVHNIKYVIMRLSDCDTKHRLTPQFTIFDWAEKGDQRENYLKY